MAGVRAPNGPGEGVIGRAPTERASGRLEEKNGKEMSGMRRLAGDVGNYASTFLIMYLLSCIALSMPFMFLGLAAGFVIWLIFGVRTEDLGTNVLGAPGIGLSLAFVASVPLAIVGTMWAAPSEDSIARDQAELKKRLGGPRVRRRPEEGGALET